MYVVIIIIRKKITYKPFRKLTKKNISKNFYHTQKNIPKAIGDRKIDKKSRVSHLTYSQVVTSVNSQQLSRDEHTMYWEEPLITTDEVVLRVAVAIAIVMETGGDSVITAVFF